MKGILEGIPSLGGEHLSYDGGFDFTKLRFVPQEFAEKMRKGHIRNSDILVVKGGATTGKTAFVGDSFPFENAVVNEHVFICRSTKIIEPRFLFRFLYSKEGQERILANFKGSAQGGINTSFAPNTQVPIAPLNEQRRIVEKLDKLLAKVESAKARLECIPTILKRFRQAVLAAAVSGELTKDWGEGNSDIEKANVQIKEERFSLSEPDEDLSELPETWALVALGNYARCSRGRFTPRPRNDPRYFKGKHPFIQIGNLPREGGFVTSHTQTLKRRRTCRESQVSERDCGHRHSWRDHW